jgi:hypothetical protein
MRAVRTILGTPVPRSNVPEAITSTFKKGALVLVNSSGYLTECGADPALILGCAERDGQNGAANGTKNQFVELASPGVLFRGYLDTSGGEGAGTTAQGDLFKAYGVAKNAATGFWYVDKSDAGNDRVVVYEFWDGDRQALGDIMHHVIFGFLFANFQGNVGT